MTDSALRTWSIIWMVARILTGEIRVVPQAALPVAHVAFNRLPHWGYDGWNAIADEPEPWAIEAAWAAWRMDDTDGNLYALSEGDIIKLGFDKRNWENVGDAEDVEGGWPEWVGGKWK